MADFPWHFFPWGGDPNGPKTPYLGAHPRSGRFSTNSFLGSLRARQNKSALDSGKTKNPRQPTDERVVEKCDSAYCDMVWLLCHLALQKTGPTELFEEIFFESVNESEIFRTGCIYKIYTKRIFHSFF